VPWTSLVLAGSRLVWPLTAEKETNGEMAGRICAPDRRYAWSSLVQHLFSTGGL
jgi:hypothetical protein